MKRCLVAIIAVLYLGSSIGASIQLHYCMGKLANWGVGQETADTCKSCGMTTTANNGNGCCKDETHYFKNTIDQNTSETSAPINSLSAVAMPVSIVSIPATVQYLDLVKRPVRYAPPDSNPLAVYIRNCVFRL